MPQESQGRINFILEHLRATLGEGRQYLDKQGKEVGAFGDSTRAPCQAPGEKLDVVPKSVDQGEACPHFPEARLYFTQKTFEDGRHGAVEWCRGSGMLWLGSGTSQDVTTTREKPCGVEAKLNPLFGADDIGWRKTGVGRWVKHGIWHRNKTHNLAFQRVWKESEA